MPDKPSLRPDLAVGEALRAVARQVLADARAALGAERPDAEAVHDFRREMKRWRALLRLLDPFLGEEGRQLRTEAATSPARSAGRAMRNRRWMRSKTSPGTGSHCPNARSDRARADRGIARAAETTVLNGDMRVQIDGHAG